MNLQMGFYYDQTRCIGCYTCAIACKDWHDIHDSCVNWMQIQNIEKGKFPNLFMAYLAVPCYHCEEPSCLKACPEDAIYKREIDGIVLVDPEKCTGKDVCKKTPCLAACRTKTPQFGSEKDAKIQKCDFCLDRLSEGKQAICVEACPMFALDIDTLDNLKAKHGEEKETIGFPYSKKIKQASIFKPKPVIYNP